MPSHIIFDRKVQFTARFRKALASFFGIKSEFSGVFHLQSNGQTERVNQNVERYLCAFISAHQDDWVDRLPWAEFALNNHGNASTVESPFFTVYSHHLSQSFNSIWPDVPKNLHLAASRYKVAADQHRRVSPKFQPGDKI